MTSPTSPAREIAQRQVTVKGRKRTVWRCEAGCNHATEALALKCSHGRRVATYYNEKGI